MAAAALALAYGVENAHADLGGLIDPAPLPTVEQVVDETVGAAQSTVDEVANDAQDVANNESGSVEQTVDQVKSTVTETAPERVEKVVGPVTDEVTQASNNPTALVKTTDDLAEDAAPTVGRAVEPPQGPSGASSGSESAAAASEASSVRKNVSQQIQPVQTRVPMRLTPAGQPNVRQGGLPAMAADAVQGSPRPTMSSPPGTDTASAHPAGGTIWPLWPSIPAGGIAGAAPAAGAAGTGLLALLLAALSLATPRSGRRLRPGPILGRSPPLIASLERPG